MPQRTFEARDEQLAAASDFVEEYLAQQECPPRFILALLTALEEVFVNVAHYSGSPTVEIGVEKSPDGVIRLSFADEGAPFDP
ncbi:MAG: ATP-binding protein, partial [Clostridia bacterium]|nr:ATP-binding protein [Clostridia bacterium]